MDKEWLNILTKIKTKINNKIIDAICLAKFYLTTIEEKFENLPNCFCFGGVLGKNTLKINVFVISLSLSVSMIYPKLLQFNIFSRGV